MGHAITDPYASTLFLHPVTTVTTYMPSFVLLMMRMVSKLRTGKHDWYMYMNISRDLNFVLYQDLIHILGFGGSLYTACLCTIFILPSSLSLSRLFFFFFFFKKKKKKKSFL